MKERKVSEPQQELRRSKRHKPNPLSGTDATVIPAAGWICTGCRALDIQSLLATDKTRGYAVMSYCSGAYRRDTSTGPQDAAVRLDLGLYQDLNFHPSCSMCTFLKGLVESSPIQSAESIYLIPALSIHRIEPDLNLVQYGKTCNYVNYVYVGQMINDRGQRRLQYCHEVPNAFGVFEAPPSRRAMQPRAINPGEADYALIHKWMADCEDKHGDSCCISKSPELSIIRLVDVVDMRIVCYRDINACDYLCLSYVWGKTDFHQRFDGKNFEVIPSTIGDAIEVVKRLGKRYLWVDMASLFPLSSHVVKHT